jgi:glutathione S-transferase
MLVRGRLFGLTLVRPRRGRFWLGSLGWPRRSSPNAVARRGWQLNPTGCLDRTPGMRQICRVAIVMYDLAGRNPALRFSPFCWRTRMALAHKGLEVETIPWRFTDKQAIAFSGADKVPVIRDGNTVVADSWAIACYLDERYSDRASLLGDRYGRTHARFINAWADTVMGAGILRLVLRDILDVLDPRDQAYFRATREQRFGMSLERVVDGREQRVGALRESLVPVRTVLAAQAWLGGESPDYADYIIFGSLQWARCVSHFELLAEDDPVASWRARMLALFGGLAGRAPTR